MTMLVAGAVLIHTAIAGLGALWQRPVVAAQNESETPIEIVDSSARPDADNIRYITVTNTAPALTPESPMPVPEDAAVNEPAPPMAVPNFSEPADGASPPKPRHAANPPMGSGPTHTAADLSAGPGGTRGTASGVRSWKTPKPPYPAALQSAGFQGATTVRITTDASGNIATVEIVKSAGNALLDRNTQSYVREFWKGPPNATRTTEFVYQLR